MADSVEDIFDDSPYYIGVQASESICASDISETDSEYDDNDYGEYTESKEEMMNIHSEGCSSGSSRLCGTVISVPLSEMADGCACCLLDHEHSNRNVDGSLKTGLTVTCSSETDTADDASSHVSPVNDRGGDVNSAMDNDDDKATLNRIRFECERLESEKHNAIKFSREWYRLKEELIELNIILEECSDEEEELLVGFEDMSLHSIHSICSSDCDTSEDFLSCHGEEESRCSRRCSTSRDASFNFKRFSALLVVMTHVPSNNDARFCGTRHCSNFPR